MLPTTQNNKACNVEGFQAAWKDGSVKERI